MFRVMQTPQTLDELGEGLMLWEHLNTELPFIEAKISPLYEQFAILDKYEVSIAEDVRTTLVELPNKFREFQQTLVDADIMLKKHKVLVPSFLWKTYSLKFRLVSIDFKLQRAMA